MRAWTTSSGPSPLLAVSPLLIAAPPPPPQLVLMHRKGTMVARLTPSSSPCLILPGWVAWRAYVVRTPQATRGIGAVQLCALKPAAEG